MSNSPFTDPVEPIFTETDEKWLLDNWESCELIQDHLDGIVDNKAFDAHAFLQQDEFAPIVNRIFHAIVNFEDQDEINTLVDKMVDQVRESAMKDLQSGWYVLKASAFLKEQA